MTKTNLNERTHLTPPVIAVQLGCHVSTVLAFIETGELRAVNLGRTSRPRWRIGRDDFADFLNRRSNQQKTTDA